MLAYDSGMLCFVLIKIVLLNCIWVLFWNAGIVVILVPKLRSCVKVEVAVESSLFLIIYTVSVDVKQH